jgi:hypothetical protein
MVSRLTAAGRCAFVVIAALLLQGCICTSCTVESEYSPATPAPSPPGSPKEIVYVVPTGDQAQSFAAKGNIVPAALPAIPVAAVLGELNNMITQLSNLVGQVGGETRSAILGMQTSASQLLSEANQALGDKLDKTLADLDQKELRIAEDAQAIAQQMKIAVDQINAGALDTAERTLFEADILAWNTSYSLPCRDKPARLVYPAVRKMRIWREESSPASPADGLPGGAELLIPVRGNFLALGKPGVSVRIGASSTVHPAEIRGLNQNELTVVVPAAAVKELQAIKRPSRLFIAASLPVCKIKGEQTSVVAEIGVDVLPPLTYALATSVTPVGTMPSVGQKVFSFYERGSDSCNDRYRADRIYSVGPPAQVTDWKVSINNQNGNSYLIRSVGSGPYSVLVEAMIGGNGRDCFLGICNCKGRGWLGYNLSVNYRTQVETALKSEVFTSVKTQSSYVFDYPAVNFPAGFVKGRCNYNSRLVVHEGDTEHVLEASQTNPNVSGGPGNMVTLATRVDASSCQVTADVTLPANISLGGLNAS